jgi:hypothetical protein
VAAAIGAILKVSLAIAAPSPEAEILFREGVRLSEAGKTEESCSAFERSMELEYNLHTSLRLATCREKNQQLASAWVLFKKVGREADRVNERNIAANARERVANIEGRLSRLTINLSENINVKDITVTKNGVAVKSPEWGHAMPVDRGTYIIIVAAPDFEPWTATVQIQPELDHKVVDVPRLVKRPVPVRQRPEAAAIIGPSNPVPPIVLRQPAWTLRQKTALGVAGGAAVASFIAFGLAIQALNARIDAVVVCRSSEVCSSADRIDATRSSDNARRYERWSNAAFGVAGVATIAAAVLWLTGDPDPAPRVALSPSTLMEHNDFTVGMNLSGTF